jgi:hypothetical protein
MYERMIMPSYLGWKIVGIGFEKRRMGAARLGLLCGSNERRRKFIPYGESGSVLLLDNVSLVEAIVDLAFGWIEAYSCSTRQ